MYVYELSDILFLSSQSSLLITDLIYILNYISFLRVATRSSGTKLCHRVTDTCILLNSYFHKLWNVFPENGLTLSLNATKLNLWNHFNLYITLTPIIVVPYTLHVLVIIAAVTLLHLILIPCKPFILL